MAWMLLFDYDLASRRCTIPYPPDLAGAGRGLRPHIRQSKQLGQENESGIVEMSTAGAKKNPG